MSFASLIVGQTRRIPGVPHPSRALKVGKEKEEFLESGWLDGRQSSGQYYVLPRGL